MIRVTLITTVNGNNCHVEQGCSIFEAHASQRGPLLFRLPSERAESYLLLSPQLHPRGVPIGAARFTPQTDFFAGRRAERSIPKRRRTRSASGGRPPWAWPAASCTSRAGSSEWLWVNNRYPRLKPAVPWWLNFDPHPNGDPGSPDSISGTSSEDPGPPNSQSRFS